MLGYYLRLSLHSLCGRPVMTGLMVAAIALGIGVSMTMLTVLHNLSGNPLPQRSGVLFHPQVDPRPRDLPGADPEPPDGLTYLDAVNLYHLQAAPRRVLTSANWLPVRADAPGTALAMKTTRATTRDLFGMFDVPFLYGSAWSQADDDAHAQVVVLSRALNDALFAGADSVGRTVLIATRLFKVVGVIDDWNPQPRFYDLGGGAYAKPVELLMPFFTWLDLPQDYGYGKMQCWGSNRGAGDHDPKAPDCSWIQLWAELPDAAAVSAYDRALVNYSAQQHAHGRFERAPNTRLRGLLEWLDHKRVVPATVRMQTWIALGALAVCLVNIVGLLVAKFLRRSGEIGVRRALGATRGTIFAQCLTEAGLIGLLGGVFGVAMAYGGLWLVRQQPASYAALARMDVSMLGVSLAAAIGAALAAGLWPAWRAASIAPALQVKSL